LVDSTAPRDFTSRATGEGASVQAEGEFPVAGSFARHLEHLAAAFALTRGAQHTLVYANSAFRNLVAPLGELPPQGPLAGVFPSRDRPEWTLVLDRAFRTGVVTRNRRVGVVEEGVQPFICTIWPDIDRSGATEYLLIELRVATHAELTVNLQRDVAERLLLSALRDQDAANVAVESRRDAVFLAAEGRRLADSLDEGATLAAMERMSLPHLGAWCIVDTLDDLGVMHRLAIIHPDLAKQAILEGLEGRWTPQLGDTFGIGALVRTGNSITIVDDGDAALVDGVRDADITRALREVGVGPTLTVPLIIRDRTIGAVTFVSGRHYRRFTDVDLALAEDLAGRSAMALDRARLYGEAIALRVLAESASQAKSAFLGMMSHELRTPLNAIGGYVDLIDLEIHGPVTAEQHVSLARIRANQRYLMGLINDLLNLTKVGSGHLEYDIRDVNAGEVLAAGVALVEPLIAQRGIILERVTCDDAVVCRADREKVIQVLVNLLSNGIRYTPSGGHLVIDCIANDETVMLRVCDTGIGISAEKLDVIFEPFVQVKAGSLAPEAGIGLGLSISRSLAQAMRGDLTVESTLGAGARFTLTLPRSRTPHAVDAVE
jgi:signal transduction histidine kinase